MTCEKLIGTIEH